MTEAHKLFRLPELVAAILSHLPTITLCACTQINALWAEEATTLLWKYDPPVSAFVSLQDKSRIGLYTSKVESLDFAGDDCQHHALFIGASFPRLAGITIDASDENHEKVLLQYLQSQLRRFDFFGGPISDAFLIEIQARCPSIKKVLIDNPRGKISAGGLLRFLQTTASISDFCSVSGLETAVTDSVWAQLANSTSLKSLELSNELTNAVTSSIVGTMTAPFRSLRAWTCTTVSLAFVQLIPYLHSLEKLSLNLTNPSRAIYSELSHLQGLQELIIDSSGNNDPSGLLVLVEKCKFLTRLDITHFSTDGLEMKDDDIKRLSELAPQLRTLRIQAQSSLTAQSFKYLGSHCRRLEECLLCGNFDLLELGTTGMCLFPNLLDFDFYHPIGDRDQSMDSLVAILSYHMPQLVALDSGGGHRGRDTSIVEGIMARRALSHDR